MSSLRLNILKFSFRNLIKNSSYIEPLSKCKVHSCGKSNVLNIYSSNLLKNTCSYNIITQKRFKKGGKKNRGRQQESDDESDEEGDSDEELENLNEEKDDSLGFVENIIEVISLRFDVVAKTAFGGSRQKIEKTINDDLFRLDNERIAKKSEEITEGHQIDWIHGRSRDDSGKIIVTRVIIVEVFDHTTSKGRMKLKIRKFKNLIIDNYSDAPYESRLEADD